MRILINGLVVYRSGGNHTYFSNLIPHLGQIGYDHEFLLLHGPWQDVLNFELPNNFRRIIGGPKKRSLITRVLWEQTRLPGLLHREKIDVMFSPVSATGFFLPCPSVIAFRNPNPIEPLPSMDLRYKLRNMTLRMVQSVAAKRGTYILFVSNYSRDTAVKKYHIKPSKTKVIYHGLGPQFLQVAETPYYCIAELSRPYILVVSAIYQHKNYLRLLKAFENICFEPDLGYDLVIAGPIGAQSEYKKLEDMIRRPTLRGRIHYLGEVPYQELPALYQGASLYILPSLLETFGHTLIEAMASEVPIVASNTTSVPEVAGNAAFYFNPWDVDDITHAIRHVLEDQGVASRLVEAGNKRVQQFSWINTAKKMIELFEVASR